MATSPTLQLTLMSASQAQKEVVFNEFLIAMDALFRGVAISAALSAPQGSPAEGDTYIVAASATGAWSGHDKNIAFYFNGWQFVTQKDHMRLYDQAATVWRVYHSSTSTWDAEPASTVSVLNDLTNVSGSPTNGQVLTYVLADGKWEPRTLVYPSLALSELTDVTVTEGAPIDGKALAWNNTDAKWEAKAFLTAVPSFMSLPGVNSPGGLANHWIAVYNSSGPGLTFLDPTTIITVGSLGQVGDVAYPGGSITTGFVLKWNGAAWAPAAETGGGVTTLAADTDVDFVGLTNGDVLTFQASSGKWINLAPTGGGSTALSALSDVMVTEGGGINNFVLYWNNGASKWEAKALAAVATSGAYSDLSGAPTIYSTFATLTDVNLTSPANKQVSLFDTTSSKWVNQNSPYNLCASISGVMTTSEILIQHIAPYAARFPSGATGSYAIANTAATASTTVTIKKNGSTVGTFTWASSGTVATFTISSNIDLAAGDILQFVAPATADVTLADIGVTLAGFRI